MRNQNQYQISRQHYYYSGERVVEVTYSECSGPDALVAQFPGENSTYSDPREAVATAIEVARAWRKDSGKRISVACGGTMGGSMELDGGTQADAIQWAREQYEQLPKCDRCGHLISDPDGAYIIFADPDLGRFCSDYCADEAYSKAFDYEDEIA